VRSLDGSAERLNRVLDVLVQAGDALTLCPDIHDALAQIAQSFAKDFGDYCCIEVAADAVERYECRVVAGAPVASREARNVIVEPLSDGRTRLGKIVCQTSAPDGFDAIVRQAVHLLAIHAGAVVAGQISLLREHHVADRLQRALLPERLPVIEGTALHAAYRPASDEAEVGGDWFDAFALPDHRIAISVGDVAGHGLDAAVIMGEVRQAIRTAAVAASTPAAVLDYVNRIVTLRESIGMVTAIFGVYDPAESTLSYAVAGHPPPLLALPDGLVRRLPAGGLPLGSATLLDCIDWTFTLPEGARAVFYTDGLIENDRDPIRGEQALLEAVRSLLCRRTAEHADAHDPATAVQERVFRGASNRDDAAVLILSREAPVPCYVFSAVPIVAPIARAIVEREMASLQIDHERRFGVLVALGEAIANAIEHAYRGSLPGLIRLAFENEARQLIVTVEDFGRWRPFIHRDERGRGIELMHAFMDSVQILSTRQSTKIVLKTKLAS
jgi:serine phosphatase RsbU (regulator of sigma subunit)/anti-sigma regulatory factor (Ser/Thr protein kinase)